MANCIPRDVIIRAAINKKTISPCQNCTNRKLHCHSECKAYSDYRENLHSQKDEYFKKSRDERLIVLHAIDARVRERKNQNKGAHEKWSAYKGDKK